MSPRILARIKEGDAQFRALMEQQIPGIYIVRDDGTFAYGNPRNVGWKACRPVTQTIAMIR